MPSSNEGITPENVASDPGSSSQPNQGQESGPSTSQPAEAEKSTKTGKKKFWEKAWASAKNLKASGKEVLDRSTGKSARGS